MHEGALKALKYLLEGLIEALPAERGISRLESQIQPLIEALDKLLPFLIPSQMHDFLDIIGALVIKLTEKAEELGNLSQITLHTLRLIKLTLKSETISKKDNISKQSVEILQNLLKLCTYEQSRTNHIQKNTDFISCFLQILVEIEESAIEHWHPLDENVIYK